MICEKAFEVEFQCLERCFEAARRHRGVVQVESFNLAT